MRRKLDYNTFYQGLKIANNKRGEGSQHRIIWLSYGKHKNKYDRRYMLKKVWVLNLEFSLPINTKATQNTFTLEHDKVGWEGCIWMLIPLPIFICGIKLIWVGVLHFPTHSALIPISYVNPRSYVWWAHPPFFIQFIQRQLIVHLFRKSTRHVFR